ncbi:Zinc finger B-box domain containing protein 1 [Dissostichus eleginoides]|uniref:Zinc finger B-box domain containing protein 1 n=1 Tax=Dissostichus eleginoides TaxID=100907 RepID=A0AAD9CEG4_DISEL|nr:Zinc finger B-box domain containing protein 1 [Dissostichus eleginoides]
MNLNDFVVLPNNKAKSVKLNARNLQVLQMETVSLAHESKEMEEKLQQLKESMSKEKEERGLPVLRGHPVTLHPQGCASTVSLSDSPVTKVMSLGQSGGFRWKSGQSGSLNSNSTKKNKENRLQKLSAGKVKIRVLKDEPPTAPPQPPSLPSTIGLRTTRKSRLRGTHCGQCEVKTAGIMCAECAEDYCIGCFTRFHQKGALKLHRMIPIQTDLQTHILAVDQEEEKRVEMIEDREDGEGFPISLLTGEYNEEESTRSFRKLSDNGEVMKQQKPRLRRQCGSPSDQYLCQLWRPRLTSLQSEELKEEEEEKEVYLSGWSSQKTALPTLTDSFSKSTADSGDEMSSDSLGLDPHEEESSDEEVQMHRRLTRGRTREGKEGNHATSHSEDPFVPEDPHRGKDLQTDEQEQLSEASVVNHNHSAGPGSERLCDPDGFPPQGLDMNSGHSDTQEHTHCDPPHTSQLTRHDSEQTGSKGHGPSSPYTEVDLVSRMMKNKLGTLSQTFRRVSSFPEPHCAALSERRSSVWFSLSGKSTPMQSPSPSPLSALVSPRRPLSAGLSRPASGSGIGPALRPLSQAAQEIMDICSVDQMGCEDPDLDADTTAHTLHDLEQELRLMAHASGAEQQAVVFGTRNRDSPKQHGNHRFTQDRAGEEQKDEEAAAQRDEQSVLSLP